MKYLKDCYKFSGLEHSKRIGRKKGKNKQRQMKTVNLMEGILSRPRGVVSPLKLGKKGLFSPP